MMSEWMGKLMSKWGILGVQLPLYLLLQMTVACVFKWASTAPQRYWPGTLVGCVITCLSITLLVNVYKALSPAAAQAIAGGAAFILCQLALLAVYRQPIPLLGWCAIALIFGGIVLFAFAE